MAIPQCKMGETNVEVQRWQFFLWQSAAKYRSVLDRVDGQFGARTAAATRMFQQGNGIPPTGELDPPTLAAAGNRGYAVVPSDFYKGLEGASYPAKPPSDQLRSPADAWRWAQFGGYDFNETSKLDGRIVIKGDWEAKNIVSVPTPQFAHVGTPSMPFHKKAKDRLRVLLQAWNDVGLLHLIIAWDGSFVPRYKNWKTPEVAAERRDPPHLSNHALGTAFDVNADWNGAKATPAVLPGRGSLRQLVEIANTCGFYWGGHFTSPRDGMHFELAKL